MWVNPGLGALLVSATVLTHGFGLTHVSSSMAATRSLRQRRHSVGTAMAMIAVVLGAGHPGAANVSECRRGRCQGHFPAEFQVAQFTNVPYGPL